MLSVMHVEKKVSDIVMILVPSIGVPVGVALLLLTICMCRRNKASNNKPTKPTTPNTQVYTMWKLCLVILDKASYFTFSYQR